MVAFVPQKADSKNKFSEAFERLERDFLKSTDWFFPVRKSAMDRFVELGFPTSKQEEWKYTNTKPIQDATFQFLKPSDSRSLISAKDVEKEVLFKEGSRLVFLDGVFSGELSKIQTSKGVSVIPIKEALEYKHPTIRDYLTQSQPTQNPFVALNTAFLNDGALIILGDSAVAETPIELLFISVSKKVASFPRVLIQAGAKSKATILEQYLSLNGAGEYFTNHVTDILLGKSSEIHYVKLSREAADAFHIGTIQVRQKEESVFSSACIDVGGKLSRNTLKVHLSEENATCHLNGLYLTEGQRHVDNTTLIDHAVPHGVSRQLYKGILSGHSKAVFNGKIFVHENAQKTDAEQTNKNMLLSDGSSVDTRPQLEIFADDVKCTHGAAIGQIQDDHLFYFKTRGISENEARKILSYGFGREVIERIPVPAVRETLDRLLSNRIGL